GRAAARRAPGPRRGLARLRPVRGVGDHPCRGEAGVVLFVLAVVTAPNLLASPAAFPVAAWPDPAAPAVRSREYGGLPAVNAHAGPPRPCTSSLASALLRLPGRLWSLPRRVLSLVRRTLLPLAVGMVAAVLMVLGLVHLPRLHLDLPLMPPAPVLGLGVLAGFYSGCAVLLLSTMRHSRRPPARTRDQVRRTVPAPGHRVRRMFALVFHLVFGGQVWQLLDTWPTRAVYLVAISPFFSDALFFLLLASL